MSAYSEPKIIAIKDRAPVLDGGHPTWYVRARSFLVGWTEFVGPGALLSEAEEEILILLPDTGIDVVSSGTVTSAPPRSVVVLPAGHAELRASESGRLIRLFAPLPAHAAGFIPEHSGGPDLRPLSPAFLRVGKAGPVVHMLDGLPNSPGMPRAKLIQSTTLSINWVEYQGPRDRTLLSPHDHADIEQGSLALEGEFVQHLRTPWMKDANTWRDDLHEHCGAGSLTIIPPHILHTTEGVGDTRHVLIDIFAPPRRDFIAKSQILNASDYEDCFSKANH
jgi:hypothetical protein